jgi:monoamine oxidase
MLTQIYPFEPLSITPAASLGCGRLLERKLQVRMRKLLREMTPEQRLRWGLENVSKVFPEMAENFEGGTSIVWDQEPWSLGAAAYYAPGEMTIMFPHVATVEGRVHFAGEHTSTLFVMEGAAQSGVRVAREIGGAV